jgi:hypothetical protein
MRKQSFRGNVFVANLPQGFTDEDLAQSFDAFGLVIGAVLARDAKTGAPKNHGLVDIAPQLGSAPRSRGKRARLAPALAGLAPPLRCFDDPIWPSLGLPLRRWPEREE